jgi:hypothetical protein
MDLKNYFFLTYLHEHRILSNPNDELSPLNILKLEVKQSHVITQVKLTVLELVLTFPELEK